MKIRLLLSLLVIFLSALAGAQQIETDILQVKMDRIYFPVGTESGLYIGAPYQVICDEDTIIDGVIEYIGPGISYSRSRSGLTVLAERTGCRAVLGTAGLDSSAQIILGTDLPLSFFNLEHETIFVREGDTVLPNLVDSVLIRGSEVELYLPVNVRFSDDSRLDAETIAWWLSDLARYGQSSTVRYFFSKLLPVEEGGVEVLDGFAVRLTFYHPLPRAAYFLSHPDFAVYNRQLRGTGPFLDLAGLRSEVTVRSFRPNSGYRKNIPILRRLEIRQYQEAFRMKFDFEEGIVDGYIGFGFEDILAGEYRARALYPEIAVMISGLSGPAFAQARFPTSLYYRFDHDMIHLYFPTGDAVPVNRWMEYLPSDSNLIYDTARVYPFDAEKGRLLQRTINVESAAFCYEDSHLRETTRYLADMAAREGWQCDLNRFRPDGEYDIRISFFPASDNIMPFALFAAVLEMNDINRKLPEDIRMDRPGWIDCDRGSRLREPANRIKFFQSAEEAVFDEGGFFPLFRPYVYAVSNGLVNHMVFDHYGYPDLQGIIKLKPTAALGESEGTSDLHR